MLQHVFERAEQARYLTRTIIATDDQRVFDAARAFGAPVRMTRADHASGTDRVAEVAGSLDADVIINLQGDEPLIEPETLNLLPELMRYHPEAQMATLATPIRTAAQWQNPNCVKVVRDAAGNALYFSRSSVPFVRQGSPDFAARPSPFLQHLGIYAYRRSALRSPA